MFSTNRTGLLLFSARLRKCSSKLRLEQPASLVFLVTRRRPLMGQSFQVRDSGPLSLLQDPLNSDHWLFARPDGTVQNSTPI